MKKTIVIAVMALISLMTVSCTNARDNGKTPAAASQTAYGSQAGKDTYSQIPQEAEKALGVAAQRSESAFAANGTRSYGYTGTTEVKGSECYCFSVFDTNGENTLHVADIAVTSDGEKVYSSKTGSKEYTELKSPAKAGGWSAKQTPAFSK